MPSRLPPDYIDSEDALVYHAAADTIVQSRVCHRCAAPVWVHWCERLCEPRPTDIILCFDCHTQRRENR